MTLIQLEKEIGPICVDSADGAGLGEAIHNSFEQGESVCIDFTGVTTLTSAFLNAGVGSLYGVYSKDRLDRDLTWKGLDKADEALLRLVQRNAVRFYSATKQQQEMLRATKETISD